MGISSRSSWARSGQAETSIKANGSRVEVRAYHHWLQKNIPILLHRASSSTFLSFFHSFSFSPSLPPSLPAPSIRSPSTSSSASPRLTRSAASARFVGVLALMFQGKREGQNCKDAIVLREVMTSLPTGNVRLLKVGYYVLLLGPPVLQSPPSLLSSPIIVRCSRPGQASD